MEDGYFWARHHDGSEFVVKREDGKFYAAGIESPLSNFTSDTQIVCRVIKPDDMPQSYADLGGKQRDTHMDGDALGLEVMYWKSTGEIRWFRPPRADDSQLVLQQLWERVTGERDWRNVPTCLSD